LQYWYSNKKFLAPSSIITRYKHNFTHGECICQRTSMLKKGKQSKQFSMVDLSEGERFKQLVDKWKPSSSLQNKSKWIPLSKKDNNRSNSPWLKSARGRSFDNLPLLFTFTLFHNNNNNNNNLSKPYFWKKSVNSEGKNQKKSPQPKIAKEFFFDKSFL
jgi:hypothetical protein